MVPDYRKCNYKVGAYVKTSGWGNRYLTVFNNVITEYRERVNNTELIKNCICYFKLNMKSQQYKQNSILMFYSYYLRPLFGRPLGGLLIGVSLYTIIQ